MPINKVVADRDSYPVRDSVRQQHNLVAADQWYHRLHGLVAATVATLPGCAIATVATQVKTVAATVFKVLGSAPAVALGATDNFWTLTGGVLAASSFRKYWLCVNSVGAASVIQSNDSTVSAAAVTFPSLPADGIAIIGTLTIATDATHTFTPGTTALNAAGITATFLDGIDAAAFLGSQVTP